MKPAALESLVKQIESIEQDAFDLGVKSAGGSIIPDVTDPARKRVIEVAFDQDQVDVILALAMFFDGKEMKEIGDLFLGKHAIKFDAALKAVIETLAIHGRFKG